MILLDRNPCHVQALGPRSRFVIYQNTGAYLEKMAYSAYRPSYCLPLMLEACFVDVFENAHYITFPNSLSQVRIVPFLQFQRYAEQYLISHALSDIPARIHVIHGHPPQSGIRMEVLGIC